MSIYQQVSKFEYPILNFLNWKKKKNKFSLDGGYISVALPELKLENRLEYSPEFMCPVNKAF